MNPSVDFAEMYAGFDQTNVQLSSSDHDLDTDDIVPDLDHKVAVAQ